MVWVAAPADMPVKAGEPTRACSRDFRQQERAREHRKEHTMEQHDMRLPTVEGYAT